MNKKELIEKYEYLNHACFRMVDTSEVLKDLKQLDELEIVKVPKYIADKIEYMKKYDYNIFDAMRATERDDVFYDWIFADDNMETFTIAWQYGCEVEEEKRYKVVMKETKQPLYYNTWDKKLFFSMGKIASHFTRQQLEKLNFGWVFDCPGIEVLEVEE